MILSPLAYMEGQNDSDSLPFQQFASKVFESSVQKTLILANQ